MSGGKSFDAIHEVEARLYRYMKIPTADLWLGDGGPSQGSIKRECSGIADRAALREEARPSQGSVRQEFGGIERLRQAVWELRQDAAKIGKIPSGYPWHIDLVMRLISALLPWYTRNLVQFGQRTTHTVQALAEAVEELARRQQSLMAELKPAAEADRPRQGRLPSQGSGSLEGVVPAAGPSARG